MEREVIYTVSGDFVYAGTAGKEKLKPGSLLIPKYKYTKESFRMFEVLVEEFGVSKPSASSKTSFVGVTSLFKSKNIPEDLTKIPLIYLESNCKLKFGDCHLFSYKNKEVYLMKEFRFFKPIYFIGHAL